jgi:hypothetical protein
MISKELWKETAGVKIYVLTGGTERCMRTLGTASLNIIEAGCEEGSMTGIAKEDADTSFDTAVFRVQALKSKCM